MRKAKVVVIAAGLIASCLFGGFAVADAATVTLDESSTDAIETVETECETEAIATTVTSIETTTAVTTATMREISTTTSAATETTVETTDTTAEATTTAQEATEAPTEEPPAPEEAQIVVVEEAPQPEPVPEEQPVEEVIIVTEEQALPEVAAEETITQAVVETPVEVCDPELPEEPVIAEAAPAAEVTAVTNTTSVSDSDYILLCNAVAHEAGADRISEYDKALVVEVIMNRVNSPSYPDTIYGVLTQYRQFTGSSTYVNLTTFSGKVTQAVKNAVDLYFADPSQFNQGYIGFTGNGTTNTFK